MGVPLHQGYKGNSETLFVLRFFSSYTPIACDTQSNLYYNSSNSSSTRNLSASDQSTVKMPTEDENIQYLYLILTDGNPTVSLIVRSAI